ncbi:hypothetical protein G6F22_013136 [Rhizopus arrhizus]|nr:hypothetical protein G6F22_013136 [Rhizopus arrhizus]
MERPAVVHPYDDRLAVNQAGDARIAGDRQRRVGGRHGVHVVGLADGRGIAVEFLAVPGRDAALLVRLAAGVGHIALAEHHVRPVGAAGVGFDARHRIGHLVQVRRGIRIRAVVLVIPAALFASTGGRTSGHGNGQQQHQDQVERAGQDRAVLAAGAADRHGEVVAGVLGVLRQPAVQEAGDVVDHLPDLLVPGQPRGYGLVAAGQRPQVAVVVRVGQAAHVKHQIGVAGHAALVGEGFERQHQRRAVGLDQVADPGAQLAGRQVRGVDHVLFEGAVPPRCRRSVSGWRRRDSE